MKRTLAATLIAATAALLPGTAQAAAPIHVTATSSLVQQHSYVQLTVHFSAPVPKKIGRISATGYAGKCVPQHCQYAQFILVPYNEARTVWIDTEVVNAPGAYTVTSVQWKPTTKTSVQTELGAHNIWFRVS